MGVQVLSHGLIEGMSQNEKINRIFNTVIKGDIVMVEGRLNADEEAILISKALKNVSGKFSGIEIAFLEGKDNAKTFGEKFKKKILQMVAKDRLGLTVIGPSKIIKEIKMNPEKLEILFK